MFCNLFFISSYTFYRDFSIFFHSFNKKLLNIFIYDLVFINLHVYNLVFGIFTIINTIVGNVISFIFFLSRKIHMPSLYIYIPFFVILYLSNLSRKLFPKIISKCPFPFILLSL